MIDRGSAVRYRGIHQMNDRFQISLGTMLFGLAVLTVGLRVTLDPELALAIIRFTVEPVRALMRLHFMVELAVFFFTAVLLAGVFGIASPASQFWHGRHYRDVGAMGETYILLHGMMLVGFLATLGVLLVGTLVAGASATTFTPFWMMFMIASSSVSTLFWGSLLAGVAWGSVGLLRGKPTWPAFVAMLVALGEYSAIAALFIVGDALSANL